MMSVTFFYPYSNLASNITNIILVEVGGRNRKELIKKNLYFYFFFVYFFGAEIRFPGF